MKDPENESEERNDAGRVFLAPEVPPCQFCADGTPGPYDFKTEDGPWAHGCERHWREHRAYEELGFGRGQLWLTEEQVEGSLEADLGRQVTSRTEAAPRESEQDEAAEAGSFRALVADLREINDEIQGYADELGTALPTALANLFAALDVFVVTAEGEERELWACGLVDEVEVDEPERDVAVYGPFLSEQAASGYAKTLSSDPAEADVFTLRAPEKREPESEPQLLLGSPETGEEDSP